MAYQISRLAGVRVNNLIDKQLRNPLYIIGILDIDDCASDDEWIIKRDGSLRGSSDYCHSKTFEFISRKLEGEQGLLECHRVLDVLNDVAAIHLNDTMAMHVHIGVQGFSLSSLKKVCANFVLFEYVIDTFMLPSRRNNKYCKSHTVELETHGSKQQIFDLILASKSNDDLFDLINPGSKPRYYKLNMQNLTKTGKRLTVEFRQHSATTDYRSVEAWVRFCMNFVYNSVDCVLPPVVFDGSTEAGSEDEMLFDVLFDSLIQDQRLKLYYKVQREVLLLVTS